MKIWWRRISNFFLGIFVVVCWILSAILKCFNFFMELILILTGSIKVVSKIDDDDK